MAAVTLRHSLSFTSSIFYKKIKNLKPLNWARKWK